MFEEMKRELTFHPNFELELKDAQNDSKLQVAQIKEFINKKVDLLIVSPNEAEPITPIVEEAFEKGIPVIVVDRKTGSSLYTAYVGANNYEIGQLVGDYVANKLNGKGNILEIWGLQGSTPAIDRHAGFINIINQYKDIKIVKSIYGEWEKEIAKKKIAQYYEEADNVDLIFAHNDVMALGAYEYLKSKGLTDNILFVGVDGLPGANGGLQFVEDKILDATFLYPTGGEEIIKLAAKILHHEPYEKENILHSTLIDEKNIRTMKLQANKIISQQLNIERQQNKIEEQIKIYQSQKTLVYFLLIGIVVVIVLGAILTLALKEKQLINKSLERKNEQVLRQKDEIARMAEKAEQATQAKFTFFTNISHEFRTPLTLILGPVEDALNNEKLSATVKSDLTLVKQNALRLLRLINQLMDFRKIENQKMKLGASEKDIVAFVKEVAQSFNQLAEKRKIYFEIKSEVRELKVFFDSDKLDKVLFNLLSNAFKFTKDSGTITVTVGVSVDKDHAIIEVEDSGIGMSKEQCEHIFDRFYSGTNSSISTGIGLSLSKEFIDLHKGAIEVVSEKWKGTKFVVSLPMGRAHLSDEEISCEEEYFLEESVAGNNEVEFDDLSVESYTEAEDDMIKEHTVLIIDDNKELRQYLKKQLSKEFEVVEAFDGNQGLAKGFECIPDLIICDVMLPGINGIGLTEKFKKDVRTSHIPIILLTAKSSIEQKIEGALSGADVYLTKPFNYKYLYHNIKGLIKTREMLKDHYNSELPVLESKENNPGKLDKAFVNKFIAEVEKNISNSEFSANDIAESLGMSRVQAYRKVKALLGYTINDYITKVRLKKAKQLLIESDMNISEIAFEVGFSSPAYFSTAFKNHFKISPSDFKSSQSFA